MNIPPRGISGTHHFGARPVGHAQAGEDCLKLTTYFGERDRTSNGLLGDQLLDIYGGHKLQTSILLRGAEGFGRLHQLQADRLLSLSEDLPVVSIAVDRRERIESMLEPILKIKRRGLITLERARLLRGEIGPVQLPEQLGEATKLTIYVGRQEEGARCRRVRRAHRPAAPARHRWCERAARGGRDQPRAQSPSSVLCAQRGRAGHDHRGWLRREDRPGVAGAR